MFSGTLVMFFDMKGGTTESLVPLSRGGCEKKEGFSDLWLVLILPLWSSAQCLPGRWRNPGLERVQQGPCLRARDQDKQKEAAACRSRVTAGSVRPQTSCWRPEGGAAGTMFIKMVCLPAGGSESRERSCRDQKAPADRSGSQHLGLSDRSGTSTDHILN